MHDDRKFSRNSNRGTFEAQPLTQLQPPGLETASVLTMVLVKRTVAAS
jgi:hypothetical protein